MADNRLIVALDFHKFDDVKALVEKLGDSVSFYKVGMELFYSEGAQTVAYLKEQGKHVFLDLKLHDIPNTAAEGLCSLMFQGASSSIAASTYPSQDEDMLAAEAQYPKMKRA